MLFEMITYCKKCEAKRWIVNPVIYQKQVSGFCEQCGTDLSRSYFSFGEEEQEDRILPFHYVKKRK